MSILEKKAMRDTCTEALIDLYRNFDKMVVLDADVSKSTKSVEFGQIHPKRFFNVGIAEQNMVGIAAGFAASGMIPVVNSFSFLLSKRSLDQLCQSVAYPRLNVKFMAHYGGYSAGPEGPTHHAIEDLGIIRTIPNMIVLVPSDSIETLQVIEAALTYDGPVYVRLCRNPVPSVPNKPDSFNIGQGYEVRFGTDLTIIAIGVMVVRALEAAIILESRGFNIRVIAMPSLKPIDKAIIEKAARETGAIVTAEEHNLYGGLGSAVAEVLVESIPVPMARVAIQDCFAESGEYFAIMDKYKLGVNNIVATTEILMKRKESIEINDVLFN